MKYALLTCTALVIALGLSSAVAAAEEKKKEPPVDYQANLAQVPAADPAATVIVPLVKELIGQHPRLLFTLTEIDALRAVSTTDPLLKQAVDDTIVTAGDFPLPKDRPDFVTQDTPAIWKAGGTYTGLAYAYHLSKEPKIKTKIVELLTIMLNEPYWADAADLDSNMGAGNNMLMVGVLFDAVCSELEPDLRAKLAAKMLTHVRRMWYLGHQQKAVGTIKYWQQDPMNNHRWHRNAGMAACLLAIADEPGINASYMLEQFKGEMDYITTWLPHDGDTHEGAGYQGFGFMYLALGVRMMDRVLGTTYQANPALHNAWAQQLYYWAPGRGGNMSFGDDSNGKGGTFERLDAPFFIGPQLSHDKLAQAALTFRMETLRALKDKQRYPWTMLPFYDSTLTGGDHLALPTYRLFSDLGAVSMRDNWTPTGVALSFKCGPYGGAKLNEFAWHTGKQTYINVAHDDPDANGFALAMAGGFIFHPGAYSMPKLTEQASTVLVDGKGQINEGSGYTQPVKDVDMRTISYLTGWKVGEVGRLIVEGETGKAYPERLKRFRRTMVWLPGEYVLVLDDLIATEKRAITWTGAVETAAITDAATGRCVASSKDGQSVPFQIVADGPFHAEIKPLVLKARWGDVALEQFRFTAEAPAVRFACALDPWGKKPSITLAAIDGGVTLTVTMDGTTDTWTWLHAVDDVTPSSLRCKRGEVALIALEATDLAPKGK